MTNHMRTFLSAGMLALALGVAMAGPFEDGKAAYESRDYPTALKSIRPLAEQGDAQLKFITAICNGGLASRRTRRKR